MQMQVLIVPFRSNVLIVHSRKATGIENMYIDLICVLFIVEYFKSLSLDRHYYTSQLEMTRFV